MGGEYRSRQSRSGVSQPPSPSRPRPRQSTFPLPLHLPRMGYICTGVDDTGGLMDGPCHVDAS